MIYSNAPVEKSLIFMVLACITLLASYASNWHLQELWSVVPLRSSLSLTVDLPNFLHSAVLISPITLLPAPSRTHLISSSTQLTPLTLPVGPILSSWQPSLHCNDTTSPHVTLSSHHCTTLADAASKPRYP